MVSLLQKPPLVSRRVPNAQSRKGNPRHGWAHCTGLARAVNILYVRADAVSMWVWLWMAIDAAQKGCDCEDELAV